MESTVLKSNPPATRGVAGAESSKPRQSGPSPTLRPGQQNEGIWQRWANFWFAPVDPIGLHGIRLLAGLLFVFWLITLAGHQQAFFSLSGWLDRTAYIEASRLQIPTGWSILFLIPSAWVNVVYWGSIAVFILFALGLWTRVTGVLTWLMVASFSANPVLSSEADVLLGVIAFYLMIGYLLLGQWRRQLSAKERLLGTRDTWLLGSAEASPSIAANLALRLLQVHFALVVVVSGLHKLQIGDWWAGVAFWYPLHPPFETTAAGIQREAANATSTLFILSLAQYLFLAWELGFPMFAWRRGWWRLVLLGGALVGWIGCLWIYRQPLFGPVYFLCCLSYLQPEEWQWIAGKLATVVGRFTARSALKLKQESKVRTG
jgi:hypothetical protein